MTFYFSCSLFHTARLFSSLYVGLQCKQDEVRKPITVLYKLFAEEEINDPGFLFFFIVKESKAFVLLKQYSPNLVISSMHTLYLLSRLLLVQYRNCWNPI
jgi:hypothetical protein